MGGPEAKSVQQQESSVKPGPSRETSAVKKTAPDRERKNIPEKIKELIEDAKERLFKKKRKRKEENKDEEKAAEIHKKRIERALQDQTTRKEKALLKGINRAPQNPDAAMLLSHAIQAAQQEQGAQTNKDTVKDLLMEARAAWYGVRNDPSRSEERKKMAEREIDTVARNITALLAEISAEEAIKENPAGRKAVEAAKEAWVRTNKDYVGITIDPDDFVRAIQEGKAIQMGGAPDRAIDRLFSEDDARFADLPSKVQEAIRRYNNYVRYNPEGLTHHAIEGIFNQIASEAPASGKEAVLEAVQAEVLPKLAQAMKKSSQDEVIAQTSRRIAQSPAEIEDMQKSLKRELELNEENARLRTKTATGTEIAAGARSREVDVIAQQILNASLDSEAKIQKLQEELNKVRSKAKTAEDTQLVKELDDYLNKNLSFIPVKERAKQIESRKFARESGIRYIYTFTTDEESRSFVSKVLSQPKELVRFIDAHGGGKEGFKEFERRVRGVFNGIFKTADLKVNQQFESSITPYTHVPAIDEVYSMVDALRSSSPQFADELHTLNEKLSSEFAMRSFTHNVAYLLQTRGNLETFADFSERMGTANLDLIFEDELVQEAAQILEQKLNQELSRNNWTIPQDLLVSIPSEGGVKIDQETIKILKRRYKKELEKGTVQEWEINRAYRMAKGIHLGATAVILDRLGEADPPSAGSYGEYTSYFGEKLLSAWNPMRHHFYRFRLPNEITEIMYTLVDTGGTMGVWDKKQIEDIMNRLSKTKGTRKFEILAELSGAPFVELQNFFGVGGILTRGGWRTDNATFHLIRSLPPERLRKLEARVFIPSGGREKDFSGVDWDASWEEFRRAGPAIMLHWVNNRAEHESKRTGEPEEKIKERLLLDTFNHIRRINPLKFAFFEKEEMYDAGTFARSIRGQTIKKLYEGKITLNNMKDVEEKAADAFQAEEDIMLVQQHALKKAWRRYDEGEENPWGIDEEGMSVKPLVTEEDWNEVFGKDDELNEEDRVRKQRAKEYFKILNEVIDSKKDLPDPKKAGKRVGVVEHFAKRDYEFFLGSEDMDFTRLRLASTGGSIIGRAHGDAKVLGEAAYTLAELDHTLIHARETNELVKYVETIVRPIEMFHGGDRKHKSARQLATVIARYYQKSWWSRILPEPLSGAIDRFMETSLSKKLQGIRAWLWDENETWEFIKKLREKSLIGEKDEKKLTREVGARVQQLGFNFARTGITILFLLIVFQALKEGMEDEQQH